MDTHKNNQPLRARLIAVWLGIAALSVTGCAPLRGYPSDPTDALTSSSDEKTLVTKYYDIGTSVEQRRLLRNQIVSARLNAYESAYSDFKRRLNGDSNSFNLGTNLSVLALGGLAATTGHLATATALAAASTGVVGARGVVSSELYFQRTLPALLAQMDSNRASAKVPIARGLRLLDADYPLAIALIDLDALRDAGGIPTAIGGITQQAEASKVYNERVLSGFNATRAATCLQAFIDKPAAEGTASRARVAAEAGKLGATPQFVTDWVTSLATDPKQLEAVARAITPACMTPG